MQSDTSEPVGLAWEALGLLIHWSDDLGAVRKVDINEWLVLDEAVKALVGGVGVVSHEGGRYVIVERILKLGEAVLKILRRSLILE